MSDLQKRRQTAGLTQIQIAVRANVSPPLVRNFERFGPEAIEDPRKRERLDAVYDALPVASDEAPAA